MESDEDEQIGVKKVVKKTRGRKKSTTTAASTKTKAKDKKTTSTRFRIKNQILDSNSEDESTIETKKPKLDDTISISTSTTTTTTGELIKTELPSTTSIGSQLFSAPSLNRVPLHENVPLNWSHKVNLIGEKSLEQRVHLCDICTEPILNYGRLLPCKHVFCYDCAIGLQEKSSGCSLCNERINRCERNSLNSVHMCNHDKQCRRTYLSQRDLLAHIQHRHTKKEKSNSSSEKSLKLRFANIKDDYQPNASSFSQKSNNIHHHTIHLHLFTFIKSSHAVIRLKKSIVLLK